MGFDPYKNKQGKAGTGLFNTHPLLTYDKAIEKGMVYGPAKPGYASGGGGGGTTSGYSGSIAAPTKTSTTKKYGSYGSGGSSGGYYNNSTGFQPTYLGGNLYSDYGSYSNALENQFSERNQPQFYSSFGGREFTGDPNEYRNAVIQDAQSEYDRQVKSADLAYKNGLISFDERQRMIEQNRVNIRRNSEETLRALGESRDDTYSAQSGYFSNISPNAFQSQQGVYKQKATDEYNRGVEQEGVSTSQDYENIAGQERILGSDRDVAKNSYDGFLNMLGRAKQGQIDSANTTVNQFNQGQKAYSNSLQDLRDQVSNQGLSFQNSINSAASRAYSPTQYSYDPTEVFKGLQALAPQLIGKPVEEQRMRLRNKLIESNVPENEQDSLLDEFLRAK